MRKCLFSNEVVLGGVSVITAKTPLQQELTKLKISAKVQSLQLADNVRT